MWCKYNNVHFGLMALVQVSCLKKHIARVKLLSRTSSHLPAIQFKTSNASDRPDPFATDIVISCFIYNKVSISGTTVVEVERRLVVTMASKSLSRRQRPCKQEDQVTGDVCMVMKGAKQ